MRVSPIWRAVRKAPLPRRIAGCLWNGDAAAPVHGTDCQAVLGLGYPYHAGLVECTHGNRLPCEMLVYIHFTVDVVSSRPEGEAKRKDKGPRSAQILSKFAGAEPTGFDAGASCKPTLVPYFLRSPPSPPARILLLTCTLCPRHAPQTSTGLPLLARQHPSARRPTLRERTARRLKVDISFKSASIPCTCIILTSRSKLPVLLPRTALLSNFIEDRKRIRSALGASSALRMLTMSPEHKVDKDVLERSPQQITWAVWSPHRSGSIARKYHSGPPFLYHLLCQKLIFAQDSHAYQALSIGMGGSPA